MCAPLIVMAAVMAAVAIKQSMDANAAAKKNAEVQRQNAMAQQKAEQEAILRKRAEQGDADAMAAFEKVRAARIDEAKIKVAKGEQGASTGGFQLDTMLNGLGFGTGLQTAADERSANNKLANTDLQLRTSGTNFTNSMRTINVTEANNTKSSGSILMSGAVAGANTFAGGGGLSMIGSNKPS